MSFSFKAYFLKRIASVLAIYYYTDEEIYHQFKLKYQTDEYPARRLTPEEAKSASDAGKRAAEEIRKEKNDKYV